MLTAVILPWLSSFQLNGLCTGNDWIMFVLQPTLNETPCPVCSQLSTAVHSHYERTIADLPCAGIAMRLQIQVRKFFCRNRDCLRRVFCERLPEPAYPYARRTPRLQQERDNSGWTSEVKRDRAPLVARACRRAETPSCVW